MNRTIKKINKVNTVDELEALNIGRLEYEISYRGGTLGFRGQDIGYYFDIDPTYLPGHFGAYCNYLGGGLRGSIGHSDYYNGLPESKKALLDALGEACIRVYESVENDSSLNDEEYPDGDTNWEALGTKQCRNAGIKSAY